MSAPTQPLTSGARKRFGAGGCAGARIPGSGDAEPADEPVEFLGGARERLAPRQLGRLRFANWRGYGGVVQAAEPQAVLTPPTEAAMFLVLTVAAGAEDELRDLLADVAGLRRSVGFRVPEGGLTLVVGLGSGLWDRVFGRPRPAGLHPFPGFAGPVHTAVATPGDLLLHIRARRLDLCFELAGRLMNRLSGCAQVVDEVHGFKFFDERDLLGFVDGTENPEGAAASAAVTIADEDPEFAGGSYVVVQKYLHDLEAWDALPVEEQQRIVGREKLSDIELPDDVKPANSHVALNTIVDDEGEEHQIVRANMPFGRVGAREFGTYFIGYARSPQVIEEMLTNMFIGKPPGNHDRILDFSTAVTGNLFFVPTADFLDDPPAPANARVSTPERTAPDDSLGIGGLKGAT
jgi:putative iron-dependent peroxidase